ncbi:hypothetical protein SKAU_G00048180 [Synaphobranchus kaupii]|uniref:Uncharacterized protein n=1 Tax=Synaphobranchus kaupii TaxID=118154 RepID=A0A9Q1J960_SYNKA|nr:hypothetical protein SKAU_G00048180 [Synaphobranchus kaupii]
MELACGTSQETRCHDITQQSLQRLREPGDKRVWIGPSNRHKSDSPALTFASKREQQQYLSHKRLGKCSV